MLNPQQKAKLIQCCNQLKIDFIVQSVINGDVSLDELPLMPERRAYVENAVSNQPNPEEQADWRAIEALKDNPAAVAQFETLLGQYVQ